MQALGSNHSAGSRHADDESAAGNLLDVSVTFQTTLEFKVTRTQMQDPASPLSARQLEKLGKDVQQMISSMIALHLEEERSSILT